MTYPRVYADFQNLDDANRVRLICAGTLEDLSRQQITMHEGLVLTLYMDDADDRGQPDELRAEGTVQLNQVEGCWVAVIDWTAVRHASEDASNGASAPSEAAPHRLA
jgi:hypothetical protein